MRTGKTQKRLLTLAISLALAGSVGYASPDNTVDIHDENAGKMDVIIVPNGTQDQTGTGINDVYNSNSGSGTYEITAIHFSKVNNYSLSVAQGNISAGRAPGSNSGDIKFTGLLWEGGTGNKLTLNGGIYTADASGTINTGSAAYLNYATLKNYSGTVTINDVLKGAAKGAAGTSQAGGSAQANGLDIDGSTIAIDGTAPQVSSTATGGNGMDTNTGTNDGGTWIDDARGNGGSADTTSMTLNNSSISGTFDDVRAEATGGNGGLNQNNNSEANGKAIWGSGGAATANSLLIQTSQTTGTEIFKTANISAVAEGGNGSTNNQESGFTPQRDNTEKGDGGQATATGVQITHNSVFNHGADMIYVSAIGGEAATTEGKGGNAEATGVSVTDSGLTHTYGMLDIEVIGGAGSGDTTDRSGSGAATATGLVLTNATTKGSISSDDPTQSSLSVSAAAGDNVDLTNDTIGLAKATGLQVSGGIAEELISTISVTSTAGENADKFGAAESTGVWVKDEGKLQLTTAEMIIGADAYAQDEDTDGGTATVTAIRGEEKTVVEVIGGPDGLTIKATAEARTEDTTGTGTGTSGTAQATAIFGASNEMSFKTANQDIVIEAITDLDSITDPTKNHAMAVDADDVKLTFDAGTASLSFRGDVKATNGTVHFYAAGTPTGDPLIPSIGTTILADNGSNGNLDLSNSTVDTTGNILTQTGTLTLSGSTLYFYKNDGKALYDTDYHAISANQMANATSGTADLYMRTNSQLGIGDQLALATQNTNDQTSYTLHILDEGMKTGYQGTKEYTTKHVLITNASGAQHNAADITYDNGIWNYTYTPEVGMSEDGLNLELKTVTTTSVRASAGNLTAADAHAAAAASSIAFTRKKLDTLGQHFGALRQDAEAENGFWVKYLGGRLDVSLHRDTDIDYNGVQVGYDHRAGDGWTIGFAGSYIKGDADYAYGSGDIKDTSFAIYGTQQRADGSYLDLVGQFGKLKNDVTAYGGSLAQRIDSDFDNNVYALSAKYGKRQTKENGSYVEPSFQLVYSNLGSESYSATTHDNVFRVHNDATDSLLLSTGVELGQKIGKRTNAYLRAALQYEFLGDVKTRVSADNRSAFYDESFDGFSLAWGLGIDHQMNETSSLHLDLGRVEGGDLKESWAVNAMCRVFF